MPDIFALFRKVFWGRYTRWITMPVILMIIVGMVFLFIASGTSWAPVAYPL